MTTAPTPTLYEKAINWIRQLDEATSKMSYSERTSYKIPTPDKELLLEVVKHRQNFFLHLNTLPDEDVLLAAVNEDGYCISFMKTQTEAVKLAAVKNQRGAIEFIIDPSIEIQVLALTHGMEPGYFDSENLSFYSNQFTDDALALVSPALVIARQLHEDEDTDVNDLTAVYEGMQPLKHLASSQQLPDTLAP